MNFPIYGIANLWLITVVYSTTLHRSEISFNMVRSLGSFFHGSINHIDVLTRLSNADIAMLLNLHVTPV